ncbi:hypothetical protein [Micromonospora arborensis]|uniref:hypothetical protein n=1 Tax=Micromonospora arborensis TaxID=2116518 RepID=UPI0011B70534|nr:hypothetical protein [Micromonospora arborensis]
MSIGDILGIAGLAVSVIGIPITFILARRGRQRPELRYVLDHDVLIDPHHGVLGEGLVVTSEGYPVTSISRTRLAIWNARGDAVRGNEILDTDPLRVDVGENGKVLQLKTLTRSRRQNEFRASLTSDGRVVSIDFKFLDAKDGGTIELIHQGTERPIVSGTIPGASLAGRSSGVSLGPHAFEALLEQSRHRRFRKFILGRRTTRIVFIAACVQVVLATGFFGYQLFEELQKAKKPALVDVSKHNLSSAKGQEKFAKEVRSRQVFGGESLLSAASPVAVIWLTLGLMYVIGSQARIPRTILLEPVDYGPKSAEARLVPNPRADGLDAEQQEMTATVGSNNTGTQART